MATPRYGDILRINGQLVEFTPVGYMPVKGRAGMLTKPAPTTKQTGPVGMPSSPPKQMPGESGPFDPNAPVPTPAPAPQQTAPVGTPSSDPTKRQPGETGPFDPNAQPPAPAPEPEAELAPPKPLQDTKDSEPAPEPEGITTFTFFEGVERGDANPNALYARGDATQVTEAELREYFNAQGSQMLKQAFGDFDNYLAYMTEREQLIQAGDYDVGNWDEATGGLTEDELMILEGEDLTQYSDSDRDVYTEAYGERMQEQSAAYNNWANSEANQALLAKYGVDGTMYNSDGDTFKWNGSAYVKTNKIDDSVNIGEIATLGMAIALSIVGTPAIAAQLTPAGAAAGSAAAMSANATASSIMSLATQLLTTGQIDPEGALRAAATSFLSDSVMKSLRDSGIFGQIGDAANSSTTDQLIDADGNVIGQIVRDSAGNVLSSSGVSANEWFTYASELGATINEGQTLVSQIASVLPEVPDWLYDAAQTTVDAVDELFGETRAGTGGQGGEGTVFGPIVGGGRDIFAGDDGADEDASVEEDQDPDILADTTQDSTGFEESILSDLLGEYLEPIRGEITQSEERIISQTSEFIAREIASLPPTVSNEEIRSIVLQAIQDSPQAETLSEEQVDDLISSAVDAVRVDLQTGLEAAETERQEIIAGQQTIRSELSDDIEELQTRLSDLPPEIRSIVSEEIENLATTSDVNAVQQSINALEQLVGNIQPGTTPEQVRQEIQDAGLATSEEIESRLEEASIERRQIEQSTNDKLEQLREGIAVQFTDAEARRLEELTGLESRLLQNSAENAAEFNALLANQGIQFEEVTDALRSDIVSSEQRTGERITGLEERMDANAIQQLSQLTGLRVEFLETLSTNEAAAIARNQGLSDQLTEQITGIRGETARQIEGMDERLTERISEYEAQTGEQLDIAAEERAVLGGQLGTLTSNVAQVAEDLIRADGRIEELDEASRERFDELGLSIEDLSLRVGVNLEALQTGMLTQDAALRELIEESTTQTEESLTQRLEQAEEGFATSLSDTEANLLSQITGVEAGVLQQLAEVEGGLQSQFGEQFGQVQEQVAGLGEQVAGVGEGLGQLGQVIGTGLLGLAAAQPTAQEIASAMPRQPVQFDPFLKGLSPFQPLTPLTLRPVQEKDALSELNKFIGRQSGMLV